MTDLLQESSTWLEVNRDEKLTIEVSYSRDGNAIPAVAATVGKTEFEIDNGFGVVERWQSRDFLILAEDLDFGLGVTFPERGDKIREIQGSTTFVYEVMSPPGQDFFRYSDQFRQTLRIHTKQTGTE